MNFFLTLIKTVCSVENKHSKQTTMLMTIIIEKVGRSLCFVYQDINA